MAAAHEALTTEEFEELARAADRIADGVRLEFVNGQLSAKAEPDGDHARIIQWLIRIFVIARPELFLTPEQGLQVEQYRKGRARPDGSLAGADSFVGQGEWADPRPVLMVVEVTSDDQDTERRDRQEKPRAYAATGIPVYLLIDRASCEVTVHSVPNNARYQHILTVPFGATVPLPAPVGIDLDTTPLLDWVR